MNEAVAAEPVEQTFAGTKLRPRKKKGERKKKVVVTPEEANKAAEANVALADISEVLDPETPAVINVTLPDGTTRDVQIFKCKARQIGYVMKFLASAFKSMGANTFSDATNLAANMQNPALLLGMISDVMDDAITTATRLTDIDEELFKDLELDDALAIILAVWTVNQNFFLARVLPLISGVIGQGEPEKAA
jgi:hypothetical protein